MTVSDPNTPRQVNDLPSHPAIPGLTAASRSLAVLAPLPGPLPRAAAPLDPVTSSAELLELLAGLLEDHQDPLQVERAVDGVVRQAGHRPGPAAKPLAARAEAILETPDPSAPDRPDLGADLATLVLAWVHGRQPAPSPGKPGRPTGTSELGRPASSWSPAYLVSQRIREAATGVALRYTAPLLSFPDGHDGAIAADTLLGRLPAVGHLTRTRLLDISLAALRLLPEEHDTVLGAGTPHPAAFRLAGDLRQLGRGPLSWQHADGHSDHLDACYPLLAPHHLGAVAAHAHGRLARALTENCRDADPVLDAIGRSRWLVGPTEASALVLGMGAAPAATRTRAVAAAARAASRNVLDGTQLGDQAATHLASGKLPVQRLAASLGETANLHPLAGWRVLDALTPLLTVAPSVRDGHLLVGLAAHLATRYGRKLDVPDCLRTIAGSRAATRLAVESRQLLGVDPEPTDLARAAAAASRTPLTAAAASGVTRY